MYHRNLIFSIKPQIFELKCVFSYFRLKTHITLLLPVYVHSWEQRKVREVTDRYDNLRIPVAASLRVAGTTPYYGANGIQDYVDGYTHDGEFILVAEDGANDLKNYPVKCVKGRIWVNNHAHVLQGKYDCADNQFLAYAISQADIESLLVGGGRAKLNAETLMGIDLLLPNKAEQIRIGKYLAQLDNLITLHQCKCQIDGCRFQSPLAITWEQRKVSELFKVTRGYVLAATLTEPAKTDEMPYPVYSSQTKDNGLMGYYKDYLYEDAITWTTDGANAGTVNYRAGKFYCTNVCGVLLSNEVTANQMIAEALNNVAKGYVSYVGNPKLMNNVMADIEIMIPTHAEEREKLSVFFRNLDNLITLHQCE